MIRTAAFFLLLVTLAGVASAEKAAGLVVIMINCDVAPCKANHDYLIGWPTQIELHSTESWNCSIEVDEKKQSDCESRVRVQAGDTSRKTLLFWTDDRKHEVSVPVVEVRNKADSTVLQNAAMGTSILCLICALFTPLAIIRANRAWSKWDLGLKEDAEKLKGALDTVSTTLDFRDLAQDGRREPGSGRARPGREQPPTMDSGAAMLKAQIDRFVQCAITCFNRLGAWPGGAQQYVTELENLASAMGPPASSEGIRTLYRSQARTVAKLALGAVETAGPQEKRNAEESFRSLLQTADLTLISPEELDKPVDRLHWPSTNTEQARRPSNLGYIARTERRGLIDDVDKEVIEKAVVVLYV